MVLYTRWGQLAILNQTSTKIKSVLPLVQETIAVKGNQNMYIGSLDMFVTDGRTNGQTSKQTDRHRQKHYPRQERRAIIKPRLTLKQSAG